MIKVFAAKIPIHPKTKREHHIRKEYEAKYACRLSSNDIKNEKKLAKCIEKCNAIFVDPDEESY